MKNCRTLLPAVFAGLRTNKRERLVRGRSLLWNVERTDVMLYEIHFFFGEE